MLALALLLDAFNASMAAVMRAHLRARDALLVMLAMHALHLLLCVPLMAASGRCRLRPAGLRAGAGGQPRVRRRAAPVGCGSGGWHRADRRATGGCMRPRRLGPVLHIGLPGAAENIAWRLAMMVSVARWSRAWARRSWPRRAIPADDEPHGAVQRGDRLRRRDPGRPPDRRGQLHEADRLVRRSLRWGLAVVTGRHRRRAQRAVDAAPVHARPGTSSPRRTTLLWITVLLEPGRTFNLVVINALRATGDARFPVVAGACSMLLVMAGGSWLLGVHFGLGLVGVWIAYAADEWLRGLMMAARWFGHGWVPAARATRRRVLAQFRR